MSFKPRKIDVAITFGTGKNGDTAGDTIMLSGYRVVFKGEYAGGIEQNTATIAIYGIDLNLLNRLTTLGPVANEIIGKNKVSLVAGNGGEKGTLVFSGSILTAYANFDAAPDVPLIIEGYSAGAAAVRPVAPSSYKGAAKVADMMRDFAAEADFGFKNNGVTTVLSNRYYAGTALDKIQQCAKEAKINYTIENTVLFIWPKDGVRSAYVPVVSPENGMIGYPIYGAAFLSIRMIFRPEIVHGAHVTIRESQSTPANGTWAVISVMHNIESQNPGGLWMTMINASKSLV